jgi:putative transcriptional regulator
MVTNKPVIVICFILLWIASVPVYAAAFLPDKLKSSEYDVTMQCRVPEDFSPGERGITELGPAKGRFLVATRRLQGSMFEKSVILLLEYSWRGATGLIINKPGRALASEVLPYVDELENYKEKMYLGGPVELGRINLLIRADQRPVESKIIFEHLFFSVSMNALKEAAGSVEKDVTFRTYAGYSGWASGQLEREIQRGSWYVVEGDHSLIFNDTPSLLWQKLIRKRPSIFDSVYSEPDGEFPVAGLHVYQPLAHGIQE